MTLHLKSHLNGFHLLNPQSLRLSSISRVSVSIPSISHRTQFQSLVVCARRRKKRDGFRRITRLLFNSLSLLSINHQILPQPLDLVIADLGGLDGGGRRGGGGGFWRGWRSKRNRLQIFLIVCVILLIYGFGKFSGKEIKNDEALKVLGLCLFGVAMVKKLKREARYLVFGILCVIASRGFGFKKDSLATLVYKTTGRRRV